MGNNAKTDNVLIKENSSHSTPAAEVKKKSPHKDFVIWNLRKHLRKEFYKVDPTPFRLLEIREAQKQVDIYRRRVKEWMSVNY
jgi:hypothetical protein